MFPGLDLYFTTVILHSTSERQVGIDLLYVIYVDRDVVRDMFYVGGVVIYRQYMMIYVYRDLVRDLRTVVGDVVRGS